MDHNYFPTDKSVTLDTSDLEMINHYLGKIEEAGNAYYAVSRVLTFLQDTPKESIIHSGMENRGAIINGLISAITVAFDNAETCKSDIAAVIEKAINENGTAGNQQ